MNHNICHECGTENEQEYIYCKNCGASLEAAEPEAKKPEPPVSKPQNEYIPPEPRPQAYTYQPTPEPRYSEPAAEGPLGGTYSAGGYDNDTIDGIPVAELSMFVGKKSASLIPKFQRMEKNGSKVSWCWPAAVLSYLFGPLGAAIWFFYRKMHKYAWLLVAAGGLSAVILSVLSAAFVDHEAIEAFSSLLEQFVQNPATTPEELSEFLKEYLSLLSEAFSVGYILVELIRNAITVACTVLLGLFSHYLYKNYCVNKIYAYRNSTADMRYYQFGLLSIGGVSGGLLTLGIALLYITRILESAISAL